MQMASQWIIKIIQSRSYKATLFQGNVGLTEIALAAGVIATLCSPPDAVAQPSISPSKADPAKLESEATRAFETFAPAGMAVAVIQYGKVVLSRGYGVRRRGDSAPVDVDTRFPLASVSKAFTATAIALLVEEGKLDWNTPVTRYVPKFAMSDDSATRMLSVRDLLVHRSGLALGAGDLLRWPDGDASDADVVRAVRHLPIATGFRDRFVYDNILYVVAGELIARVSGRPWTAFMADRLFEPLGLRSCSADPALGPLKNRAVQHARAAGASVGQPLDTLRMQADPAGSVHCSIRDVARWALFQMGDGSLEGRRLLRPETMAALHEGVIPTPVPSTPRRLGYSNLSHYALGWFASDFAGTLLLDHSGAYPGAAADIGLLPASREAVVVLMNDQAPAPVVVNHLLAMLVQGKAATDWIGDALARRASRPRPAPAPVVTDTGAVSPAKPLTAYAGTYRDPWYGVVAVTEKDSGLNLHLIRSRLLNGPLIPLGGDRFLARWPKRDLAADAIVTFVTGADGRVARMTLAPASDRTDFSYDYAHLAPVRVR